MISARLKYRMSGRPRRGAGSASGTAGFTAPAGASGHGRR